MPHHRIVDRLHFDSAHERESLVAGLFASPASIAPKYFYDELGCALFGAICALPEYYPTRTEIAIFDQHRAAIADAVGRNRQLVDLGAGDCSKAAAWLPHLQPQRYVAVDIARAAIDSALGRLALEFRDIEMLGVVTDFARELDVRATLFELPDAPVTFFYPGSSIGNFEPAAAVRFVREIRDHCRVPGSGLLIGVDAKKDSRVLDAAYDDAIGVTAAFNRNVLAHVNRVLGADFRPAAFAHRGFYNEAAARIEMHLEALDTQQVTIDGRVRTFESGERIHTEDSYKYAPAEFEALLRDAGFGRVTLWQDAARWFSVFYAE